MYYRIYLLDLAGKIRSLDEATCLTDDDAFEAARPLLPHWPAIEIWETTRMVGTLTDR